MSYNYYINEEVYEKYLEKGGKFSYEEFKKQFLNECLFLEGYNKALLEIDLLDKYAEIKYNKDKKDYEKYLKKVNLKNEKRREEGLEEIPVLSYKKWSGTYKDTMSKISDY